MSTYVITGLTYGQSWDLAHAGRAPSAVDIDPTTGTWTLTHTPDLTAEERTALDDLVATFHTHGVVLTLDEYRALKPDLAALRTFRQQSQAQFMALTATQRDRALFDVVNAQTNVLRALLRD